MRIPKITSLYGRIFAIFWFTMLLVLIAVLSLPHLDPRVVGDIPQEQYQRILKARDNIEEKYSTADDLDWALANIQKEQHQQHYPPRFLVLSDLERNIVSIPNQKGLKLRVLHFITSIEDLSQAKRKLYSHYMIAGPVPIKIAHSKLLMFVGVKWNKPPPIFMRFFDHPSQLLLAMMLVSTPLLLWLAWALSQPARKLERAAQRVKNGRFEVDPQLEVGTAEFRKTGESFNQMVEAVNQMISGQQRLLSDISHELRSPLTRLRMANALAIRKQGESPELERIDTEAQRLEQMISELLTLSRMQVDSHITREVQPISSLWEEILKDAQFEAEQMGKELTFSEIPERSISGNPKLLMSALDNITRNAIYYGKDQVDVQFHVVQDQLTICVNDNGDGVPDDELDSIFRPFYRVSTARDRNSGGTGLGLTITESAIRQHSGTITASRSKLGGLQIEITLPILPL
ncbi:envelope stress sensor histidine kinase CpxA [Vibrio sp. IB15]|uniref:histidine kinase n=2 Tax=Vibrio chagasii TaxID=170679 RepID=A0A7V7NW49_9VIBR|nr:MULTISPECIES: envelope stress sensor histidine kinase CpxA [Vibrio]KAB0481682.1 envelope stress sensor histidine kinase CpxA [Vibrio chagasii]MBJ2146622.1 envelope stress sensor histidine kinase CpxA [Vibrio sp. IB15]